MSRHENRFRQVDQSVKAEIATLNGHMADGFDRNPETVTAPDVMRHTRVMLLLREINELLEG